MVTDILIPGLQHPEMIDQVTQGMQVLDRDRLGWELSVYLPDLDICSACTCVLGQVYRDDYLNGFAGAAFALFGVLWTRNVPDEEYQRLADHGFVVDRRLYNEGEAAKLQLESVWKVLVGQRTGVQAVCPNDHENISGTVFCGECGESLREEVNSANRKSAWVGTQFSHSPYDRRDRPRAEQAARSRCENLGESHVLLRLPVNW